MTPPTQAENERLRRQDWVLIAGVVLSPMTLVGTTLLNLGELLVLAWCLLQFALPQWPRAPRHQTVLWYVIFVCILLGSIIGIHLTPDSTRPFQLTTWAYFSFIFLTISGTSISWSLYQIELILNRIATMGTLIFAALFTYALTASPTIGHIPLWFADMRFSPASENPHYFSLFIGVAIFINARAVVRQPSLLSRAAHVALVGLGMTMGFATQSSTLLVAVVLTVVTMAGLSLFRVRATLPWVGLFLCLLLGVLKAPYLHRSAIEFIEADANGLGRVDIWKTFGDTFSLSPFFGLGPGTHGDGGFIELHNTFLEILAMAGLVGLIAFLTLFGSVLLRVMRVDLIMAGPLLLALFYGIGGFSARRLVFWAVLAIVSAYCQRWETDGRLRAVGGMISAIAAPSPSYQGIAEGR